MRIPFSVYDFFGYLASGFLLLCAADFGFDGGWLLKKEIWPVYIAVWTVSAYVIGHIVAHISSFFIEHIVVRSWLISPEVTLFNENPRHWAIRFFFPVFSKPFPKETRERVLERAKRAAGIDKAGRGLFFHCHPIVYREKHVAERLTSFLRLYGFARNICMASMLAAGIILIGGINNGFDRSKWLWLAVSLVVSVAMFYRYLKFFRHYTQEVFRAYAELPDHNKGGD